MSSIIILDNYSISYLYNIENTVPIKSWYGNNKKDNELSEILPILKSFAKLKDVRKTITNIAEQVQASNLPTNIDPKYQKELEILNKAGNGSTSDIFQIGDNIAQEIDFSDPNLKSQKLPETIRNVALFTCCQVLPESIDQYSSQAKKTKGDIDRTLNQSLNSESSIGFSSRSNKKRSRPSKMKSSQQYKPPLSKITEKDSDEVPFSPSSSRMPPDAKASAEELKFLDVDSENSFMNQFIKNIHKPSTVTESIAQSKESYQSMGEKKKKEKENDAIDNPKSLSSLTKT